MLRKWPYLRRFSGHGVQGRGELPLRAGGGSGGEGGTTLPREQGLQGECGTMTLPLSAQECPPHRRPRRAGFRGSALDERVDRTEAPAAPECGLLSE